MARIETSAKVFFEPTQSLCCFFFWLNSRLDENDDDEGIIISSCREGCVIIWRSSRRPFFKKSLSPFPHVENRESLKHVSA